MSAGYESIGRPPITIWTYGHVSLADLVGLNKGVAYQFLVEPWQRCELVDLLFFPLGSLLVLAVLQMSLFGILFLPLQFVGESLLKAWTYMRAYNRPEIRDPSKRWRRRLSIDGPVTATDMVMSGFKPQGQAKRQSSLFLTRLPLEIRLEVYRLVLGDRYFQILAQTSPPYELVGTIRRHAYMHCVSYDCPHPVHRKPSTQTFYCDPTTDVMASLLVCRQMYREAVNVLYSANTFKFRDHNDVSLFLQSILPQRRRMIRRMTIDINSHGRLYPPYTMVEEPTYMAGLQELYIYIPIDYWCHETTNLSEMIKISLPNDVKSFKIGVPLSFPVPKEDFEIAGGVKYELVRQGRRYDHSHGV